MKNYKRTLNLPITSFPMRANLSNKEPEILKKWIVNKIYELVRTKRKERKKFFLHDGPPYANGSIHLGHVLNKVLKDMIIKSKNMSGFDALYTPSWDCHGLPIEHQIELVQRKENISNWSKNYFRKRCRKYASHQVEDQKKDFIRLGVLSNWDNSYLTMSYKNEANIIRSLSKLIKKKFLYRGDRPIHWCIKCQSSLAEAEVEYIEKNSYSTFFLLKFIELHQLEEIFKISFSTSRVYIVVWTTTPWTLPTSQAVALNPHNEYALIKINDYFVLIAKDLVVNVLQYFTYHQYNMIGVAKGSVMNKIKVRHPLLTANSIPIILGLHVKNDIGSGAVHTSPDHGVEDYSVGIEYGIKPMYLVDKYGCYSTGVHDSIIGKNIFDSEKVVLDLLKCNHSLMHYSLIKHSYPHCWRHKNPLIFYSTSQWFININKNNTRKKSVSLIKKVLFSPKWGKEHMLSMISKRPDWCISRQRTWGVPMSIFINKKTRDMHPNSAIFLDKIADRVEKEGIEAWWNVKKEEFLSKDECQEYKKSTDVLDVWFDSGSITLSNVYLGKELLSNVADLYCEGVDQYRGWFMSSLLISMATDNIVPYKSIISHGFVVDKNGFKMSKSIGNVIDPKEIVDTFGADILRLWVASVDYSKDSVLSKEILKQTTDNYRKIRNTIRFLLSNISDFNPDTDLIDIDQMVLLDVWIISKTRKTQQKIVEYYEQFNFNKVVHCLMDFCSKYMGSFYLEIIKDRQYTSFSKSSCRRSCQTAMYLIIQSFSRWIAPFLSFTADEVWDYIPGKKEKYIFTEEWFNGLFSFPVNSKISERDWEDIFILKNEVNKVIENARSNKMIRSSLESSITIYTTGRLKYVLDIIGNETKFLFLTSRCIVQDFSKSAEDIFVSDVVDNLRISINVFSGKKCNRCWNYVFKFSDSDSYSNICVRCLNNILGLSIKRIFI